MSNYVLDAYAWIEYLNGTENGEKIRKWFTDSKNSFFTHKVTFAETISVTKRRGFDPEIAAKAIGSLSQLYEGDLSFFKDVGLLHAELRQRIQRFGLADTFVLLTARKCNAKIITGDPHFQGFGKEIIFLDK